MLILHMPHVFGGSVPTMTLIITERRTETPESESDETHDVGACCNGGKQPLDRC